MTVNGKRMDQIFLNMRLFIWRIVWESNPLYVAVVQFSKLLLYHPAHDPLYFLCIRDCNTLCQRV